MTQESDQATSHRVGGGVAVRGASLTLAGQWTKFMLQAASMIVLARILSPVDFGLYSLAFVFVGAAQLLSDFGFSSATIQAPRISRQQQTNLFWLNTSVSLIIAVLVIVSRRQVSDFFNAPKLSAILAAIAVVFVVQAMTAQFSASASRSLKFAQLAVADVLSQVVGVSTAIIAAVLGAGVWALVAQQAAAAAVVLVVLVRASEWSPGLPRRAPMRSLVVFGGNTFGVQLLSFVSSNVDSLFVGRVLGPIPLGVYDKGFQFLKMPVQQIATPLTRVALPVLSRMQGRPRRFSRAVRTAQLCLAYSLGGVFAVAGGLAHALLPMLLGPGWSESASVFQVLAIGGVFQALGYVYYWTFMALGMTGIQLRYSIVTRAILVVLIAVAVSHGIVAVSWAVTVSFILNWVVLTCLPMRRAGIKAADLVLGVARPMVLAISAFALTWEVQRLMTSHGIPNAATVVAGLGLGVIAYGIVLFAVPGFVDDRHVVIDVVRKIRK